MKNTSTKTIRIISIVILLGATFFYKSLFFWENKKRQKRLHITPYTREYFQNETGETLSLNLQPIQKYNQYCQTHKQHSCIAFLYQSRIADQIRLKSVQHAGQIKQDKTKLFYNLNNITILQNNWTYPYIFTQLFLPSKTNSKLSQHAIDIGQRGIQTLCKNQQCNPYTIAESIAFTYYYYLHDSINASKYYQLASQSPWAPTELQNMPAIVLWRGKFHLKSAYLRLQKAKNLSKETKNLYKQKYYFQKALMERTLDLITEANTWQQTCHQNLSCLQQQWYITNTIQQRNTYCKSLEKTSKPHNWTDETKCRWLQYGQDNNYITTTGNLIYPLNPNMTYRRRSDIQDRWIILKSDILHNQ